MSKLTIVMYHYVRDLTHSRYPEIKGLQTELFHQQVAYIAKHYHPISAYDLMDAIASDEALPPKAILLTFDDAYIEHFNEVFPVLDKAGISACFFPPAKCVLEHQVLDVNKIHFILACVSNKNDLVASITQSIDSHRAAYELDPTEVYWDQLAVANGRDPAEVVFVKRMLQRELPEALRKILTDALFKKYVSDDERAFAQELYTSVDQIECLQRNGMYVGSHSFDHYWLNSLSEHRQRQEIDLSLKFLRAVGSDTERWIMCYPYGAYDETTLKILREKNCVVGLTTRVDIANTRIDDPLTLPRLDTNDLPKSADTAPNAWTREA